MYTQQIKNNLISKYKYLDVVEYIPTNNVCNTDQLNQVNGIIATPNYPQTQANLQCSVTININGQKLLNLYSVSTGMHTPLNNQE